MDELSNLLQQGTQPGGAAAAVAVSRNWRVLDEDDRRLVRRQLFAMARERAEQASASVETLWTGACEAAFGNAAARMEFAAEGGCLRFASATATLPAFELDLDDSRWDGELAGLVRERLVEIAFLRSLICERIENGLADRLRAAIERRQESY